MLFDLEVLRQKKRDSRLLLSKHDFLFKAVSETLMDRILGFSEPFSRSLYSGQWTPDDLLNLSVSSLATHPTKLQIFNAPNQATAAVVFEESMWPFRDQSFDLVSSHLALHWIEDLPKAMMDIKRTLSPGGLFLGALWGAETLKELKHVFAEVETSFRGGVSPHVIPLLRFSDAPALMHHCGFKELVVDQETFEVHYTSLFLLFQDLRGMGERNCLKGRYPYLTSPQFFKEIESQYQTLFPGPEGGIKASFQVIYLSGWCPA